jgi:PAS domain S-box-containing protein
MLYLENGLLPGAFTPERLALCGHLAAQAAISIQNARLYADLAQENAIRRQTEAALRESEARIRSIIDNSTAMIFLKDLEGRYLMANRWFAKMVHLEPAAIVGKTDVELFGPAQAEAYTENDRKVLEADAPLEFEEELLQDDGPHAYISIKFPLHDEAGRAYATCGLCTDITERKRAAAEIARKRGELAQARELDRLKSEFVHSVSHELRTPLTAIKGFVEFLEEGVGGPLSQQQLDFVQQINKSAVRLELLANDMLDVARIDAGTFRMELQEADLAATIREVAASFRPQAAFRELQLSISVPETPLGVSMDPLRIEQVLNNLISNAVKFAAHGGRVEVRLRQQGDRLRCEVEDTGAGIAPEDVAKLFQRFSQLKSGIKAGGTGLGLSISKAIVEAHGGRIGVESTPGVGSTFWFTLPLRR